jgi:WD40 repeat protein
MSADPADRTATLQPSLPSRPAATGSTTATDDPGLPVDDPDRYEQVAEHARGGLGRVVRAVDKRLGRTVAVKELLRQDDWHEARFVREALITARLEHPGIVPVHEAGRWPNGAPYYVMKLVEGRTLKELFAEKQSLRDRLGLLQHVIAIADAVGYAHSEGVIHRDLKPSNVIVGEFGETIVVDWGLARDTRGHLPEPRPSAELLEARAKGSGASTISGKVVGTPAYMAPEQARGEPVDERADVYAIGAVLYELLAGKAPHADTTPQAVIDRVIAGPPAPLATITADAPLELVDVVQKAIARVPGDRYANASALAEDLRRFQTGKLVSAHSYTTWQLVSKKLKQHRAVVLVALASAIVLAAVGVESFRSVVAERDIARSERARAEVARRSAEDRRRELVLVQAQTSLRKDPTAALAWLKLHPVSDADRTQVVDVIDEALALGAARHVFRAGDWVLDAVFTPDGKTVIAGVRDGRIRAYDLATGHVRELGKSKTAVEALAISPDGKMLVTGSGFGDVTAWSVDGTEAKRVLSERGGPVTRLDFDRSGEDVLVERDGAVEMIDLDGTVTKIGPESAVRSAVAIENPSHRVAQISPNEIAAVTPDGMRPLATADRLILFLGISPDGERVVLHDGHTLWSVPYAGGKLTKLADYESPKLVDVVWSPDRSTLALIGMRPEIVLVDTLTGTTRELRGHTDALYTAQFTHDGLQLLTASDDGTARVWNVADGSSLVLRGHDDDVYRARWSPDEKSVATASLDSSLRVWPIDRSGATTLPEGGEILDLDVAGDYAIVRTTNGVARWSLTTRTREQLFARGGLGIGLPSPDGSVLVVQKPNWSLELRRRDGTTLPLRGHRGFITHIEWSRDSKELFTSSVDGTLRRWNTATGQSKLIVDGKAPVRGFAVAADGRIAAQVGEDVTMLEPDGTSERLGIAPAWCGMNGEFERVRDRLVVQTCDRGLLIIDGKIAINLPAEGYHATRIAVSPDGQRIAGAMSDRTVRLWDAQGQLISVLRGHSDLVMDVAFSPDGSELASASYDKTVRVWELATGRYRVLRGHTRAVDRVTWRSRSELVSASYDGTIRIWPVPVVGAPSQDEITARLDAATTAAIDAQNRATTIGS